MTKVDDMDRMATTAHGLYLEAVERGDDQDAQFWWLVERKARHLVDMAVSDVIIGPKEAVN